MVATRADVCVYRCFMDWQTPEFPLFPQHPDGISRKQEVMHIGNSDPEVGPPFVVGASGGVVLYRGHPAKSRDAEAESLLGRRRALFAAQKHRNRLCAVSGGTVTRSGPWAGCIKLPGSGGAPHSYVRSHRMNFSALKGWESGRTPGGPSPAACCGPLSSAECEKSSRAKWPGSFCVDLTCGPQRTYSESAPPSCWSSRTHCRTRRRPSRRCRSERCRHPHRR